MPNCIIATGNIGCGKSTISQKYVKEGYVIISRDQLRYGIGNGKYIYNTKYEPIIFKTENYLFKEFLKLGVNIFIDEVGISRKLRKNYLKVLKRYPEYKAISIELPRLSKKDAVDRRMKDPHGQYDRKLWESVWDKFNARYESPSKDEGFFTVIRLSSIENEN